MILQKFGAAQAAMTHYIVPIVATFGGVYWPDEIVTNGVFVGMAAILIGIVLIGVQKPRIQRIEKRAEIRLAS